MNELKVIVSVFVVALCVDLVNASIDLSDSYDIIEGIQEEDDEWVLEEDVFSFSEDYHYPHDFRTMPDVMINYAIKRGCSYLMGFVKNMFFHGGHKRSTTVCDWRRTVERSCAARQVPPELCCAMISCGASYSLVAVGASRDDVAECNMTSSVASMQDSDIITGKREVEHSPPLALDNDPHGMCGPYNSYVHHLFGKRDTPDAPWSDPTNNPMMQTGDLSQLLNNHRGDDTQLSASNILHILLKALSNTPHRAVMPTLPPTRSGMTRWCKKFSRSINKKYHFNEVKFVQRSMYWIIDVYKTAHEHHVPTHYTHGLVGCGMSYAMNALNAEQWQSRLYKLVLK